MYTTGLWVSFKISRMSSFMKEFNGGLHMAIRKTKIGLVSSVFGMETYRKDEK
jgi:hypothetical protein